MLTNEFGLEIPNMRLQDMESEKITPGEAGEPADPGDVKEDEEDEDEDDEKSSDGDDVDDEGDENEDEDEDDEDDPDELKVDSANQGPRNEEYATRERAILALLSEASISAAVNRCGVSERTLRRWMTDDEAFKRELAAARTAMFQAGMHRVQALASEAIDTLAALMGRTVPPNVRLGAARTVAELGMHQYDAETILKKLDDLERLTRKA
jgi:hypothetical protein